jgi:hypothetical protein
MIGGCWRRFGVLRAGAKNLVPYALKLYGDITRGSVMKTERRRTEEMHHEFRTLFCIPGSVHIRFLGVWDTVKAFGIFNPRSFPHIRHNDSIDIDPARACRSTNADARSCSPVGAASNPILGGWARSGQTSGSLVRRCALRVSAAATLKKRAAFHGTRFAGCWAKPACRHELDDDAIVDLLDRANQCADRNGQKFYQRHESRTLSMAVLDVLHRPELKNAPLEMFGQAISDAMTTSRSRWAGRSAN